MPLRDIALTAFVFGMLPFVFRHPDWGILLWTWIGLMNPHRLSWGFAFDFPFAVIVGGVTILAVLISNEPKRLPVQAPVIMWGVLIGWMTLSTVLSLFPATAWEQWVKIVKIQLFILLTLMVMQRRERIIGLVWVSTVSLAYFGVKGGIYTLTGGSTTGMVIGPPGGFIAGNTEISLAITMTIPLMRWLQLQSSQRWIRWGLTAAMGLTAVAVLGSYSRGGLLAVAAMGALLWLKSRKKFLITLLVIALLPVALATMPDRWYERMSSIESYQKDSSAMGRINAWGFAYNLAKSRPLTGGGFQVFEEPSAFQIWAPNPTDMHSAHSIWFQVLGEHGFVGLALFLVLWFTTWRTGSDIIRRCHDHPPLQWANDLARMIQVSLVGYWVGGSFLGLANWDYPYVLMAILVLTKVVINRELEVTGVAREQTAPAPSVLTHSPNPGAAGQR